MKNSIIYITVMLCLLVSKLNAQETFESKIKIIEERIEQIIKEEKTALKAEVEAINNQLEKGGITKENAELEKKKMAEASAVVIENKITALQAELKDIIQQKVNGNLKKQDEIVSGLSVNWKPKKHKSINYEKRTTSQFVFAAGLNNVATEGKIDNSDFRYLGSHFYEVGATYNTRLFKESNLFHFKYGVSVMYNNIRPTDNRVFVKNGDKTTLVTSPLTLSDSRFKNVYLVAPFHLEFDFSRKVVSDEKSYFRTHQSYRFGFGGYVGARIKSKQFQEYSLDNQETTLKQKGDFNANDFIYGLSTYIGYKQTSLYFKYDLNPLFEKNIVKQNTISLGLRFDLN
ncbi:MAG: hypothetical protein RLZZ323_1165 [Bacteroidota bacterium]